MPSREVLVRVAKLYFEQGHTQADIAELLGISRQTVGRILKQAESCGVVQIRVIDDSQAYYKELREQLHRQFGLRDLLIEPVYEENPATVRQALGARASKYLTETLQEGQTLACSWGRTLLEVVKALQPSDLRVDVVQLNGTVGYVYSDINSSELARILARKFRGQYFPLPAPGIVDSADIRESLLQDGSIRFALEKARCADVAAIGIGSLDDSLLYSFGIMTHEELTGLKAKGVVGDICLRLIDAAGELVQTPWDQRMIGIDRHDLQQIGSVIGIAGGERKVDAILACLRSRLLDVLITDSHTVDRLRHRVVD